MMLRSQRGVALLMVLWVITLLMLIVSSFTILTRTEANSTVFFRNGIQKMFYAEWGHRTGDHGGFLQANLQKQDIGT
ncbi:MAG TPA: hypothetical protein VHO84_06775 [Syntrophorhabdaceae bacterium]|nr:hypothetical protein [Syntrophorhabdaceae bacterium]